MSFLRVSYRDVVNPDEVGAVERDGIPAPDVFVVQVRDNDVLDNHVAAPHPQPLSLDGGPTAHSEDRLVAPDVDGLSRSLPPGGRGSLAAVAALLDDLRGAVTPGRTHIAGLGTFGLGVVVLFREGDDAGLVVGEELGELVNVFWCDGGCAASSSDTSSETLDLSRHHALGSTQAR